MSNRQSYTVRFDPKDKERLQRWANVGHRGSIPQLLEWLAVNIMDGISVEVPKQVNQPQMEQFDSLGNLCLHFWDKLQANPRIDKNELALIADGKKAGEVTLLRIANTVGYPEEYLEQLNQGAANGHAHNHH